MSRGTTFTGPLKIRKSDGSKVIIADEDGNIDAPVTTTNLSTTGNTTLGNAVSDTVTLNGAATVAAAAGVSSSVATVMAPFIPVSVQQALSGAGAVNITSFYTAVTSTGTDVLTLAASTVKGQMKKVQMIVDGGDATLTFNTDATIVFADVGDTAELIWNGTAWVPVALYNIVDGATAPDYTPAS